MNYCCLKIYSRFFLFLFIVILLLLLLLFNWIFFHVNKHNSHKHKKIEIENRRDFKNLSSYRALMVLLLLTVKHTQEKNQFNCNKKNNNIQNYIEWILRLFVCFRVFSFIYFGTILYNNDLLSFSVCVCVRALGLLLGNHHLQIYNKNLYKQHPKERMKMWGCSINNKCFYATKKKIVCWLNR